MYGLNCILLQLESTMLLLSPFRNHWMWKCIWPIRWNNTNKAIDQDYNIETTWNILLVHNIYRIILVSYSTHRRLASRVSDPAHRYTQLRFILELPLERRKNKHLSADNEARWAEWLLGVWSRWRILTSALFTCRFDSTVGLEQLPSFTFEFTLSASG